MSEKIPDLADHHIFMLNKEIDADSTGEVINFIMTRNLMNVKPKHIRLIVNSPGGDVTHAFALIDIMKCSKIPVHTWGLGEIGSCAFMIFIAGQNGHRYISKNTSILSHQYSWDSGEGKNHELMARVREYKNTHHRIVEHYKKCTGMTETKIKKYLLPAEDVWMTGEEAIKYGIADKLLEFY